MCAMTLAEYIKTRPITDAQLAQMLDCSTGALRKWKYGERTPRPDQMRKIAEVTDGLVTPNDFLILDGPSEGEAA